MITLELSEQMVAVIGEALGNAPYKLSAPIIAEIQKQIEEQQPKGNGDATVGKKVTQVESAKMPLGIS